MVKDIRKIMRLFVAGLGRTSRKWVRVSTFIGDINVSKLLFYVQKVEEKKLKDKEEYKIKKA